MLCASHCKSLSILKVLRVPLSFSLFNFQGPTHFLESFLSVLTEPLSTVRELLYHIHLRLSTLFSKFLKSFLKSLSLLFQSFFLCFQTFLLFVLSSATLLLYHNYTESQYLFKFQLTNQFVFSTYILYKMLHLSIVFYKYDIFYLYQDNLSTKTIILILLTSL